VKNYKITSATESREVRVSCRARRIESSGGQFRTGRGRDDYVCDSKDGYSGQRETKPPTTKKTGAKKHGEEGERKANKITDEHKNLSLFSRRPPKKAALFPKNLCEKSKGAKRRKKTGTSGIRGRRGDTASWVP